MGSEALPAFPNDPPPAGLLPTPARPSQRSLRINELSRSQAVEELAVGLERHSLDERVRVLEAVVAQASDALVLSTSDDG